MRSLLGRDSDIGGAVFDDILGSIRSSTGVLLLGRARVAISLADSSWRSSDTVAGLLPFCKGER